MTRYEYFSSRTSNLVLFLIQFERQCDDYVFLPARGEHRGVRGLVYDDVILPESQLLFFSIPGAIGISPVDWAAL